MQQATEEITASINELSGISAKMRDNILNIENNSDTSCRYVRTRQKDAHQFSTPLKRTDKSYSKGL